MSLHRRSSYRSALIIFSAVLLVVFLAPGLFTGFRTRLGEMIAVPAGWLSAPALELKKFLLYHKTYDDYRRIQRERDQLKSQLINAEETERRNQRLEALLELRAQMSVRTVGAFVVGRDLSNWESSVLVDKGIKDGVRDGAPVVTALGVVGRVVEAGETASRVMLLTDPQFSVTGRIRSGQQSVLVTGSLNGFCRIRYLEAGAQVQTGDHVVTSRLSSAFPENILIGEVTAVHPGADGLPEFIVRPFVPIYSLEEVLILLDFKRYD